MVVKVSKPEINVREKISELDKPSGTAGQAMLAAETPQEQFNLISAGRRNLIINGAFDVWQRGTSFGSSPGYTADRWWAQSNHSGSAVTQQEFTVGQTEVPNSPRYFLRSALTYNTTPGDRIAWGHKIEDWRSLVNRTVTISGWYRRTAVIYGTGMQLMMKQSSSFYDGTLVKSAPTDDVFPMTSEWRPFKYTVFVPSSFVGTMTSTASFDIRLYYQTCYQAGNFDIANVQLEYGNTATPFEHRSYGEELQLCQRYFQKLSGVDGGIHAFTGWFYTSAAWSSGFFLPQEMRAKPSVSFDGTAVNSSSGSVGTTSWALYAAGAWRGAQSISADLSGSSKCYIRLDSFPNNAVTSGFAGGLYGGSGCAIKMDAEL